MVLQADRQMLVQRIALQASHVAPLRDDVEEFIVRRMIRKDPVRQVIVIPVRAPIDASDL